MRVLIVEQEPLIAMSLAAELRQAGYEVLGPSNDADEALCLADDQGADMALIDADLHGRMTGIELARLLRARCEVPTLLLTTEPATHANADAAVGLISLPFDPADIPETIQAAATVLRGDRPEAPRVPNALQLFADEDDALAPSSNRTH